MQNQSKSIIVHTLFKSISAVKLPSVNSANTQKQPTHSVPNQNPINSTGVEKTKIEHRRENIIC